MSKKQKAILARLDVDEPRFYYVDRSRYGDCCHGRTTVCLLTKNNSLLARGLAICSPRDQFVKRMGRAMALGRAIQALVRMETTGPIKPRVRRSELAARLFTERREYGFKSSLRPKVANEDEAAMLKQKGQP